jgi:hypothetical protein
MWGKVVESGENVVGECRKLAFFERISSFFAKKSFYVLKSA